MYLYLQSTWFQFVSVIFCSHSFQFCLQGRKNDAEDIKEEKRIIGKRRAKEETESEVSEEKVDFSDEE